MTREVVIPRVWASRMGMGALVGILRRIELGRLTLRIRILGLIDRREAVRMRGDGC